MRNSVGGLHLFPLNSDLSIPAEYYTMITPFLTPENVRLSVIYMHASKYTMRLAV